MIISPCLPEINGLLGKCDWKRALGRHLRMAVDRHFAPPGADVCPTGCLGDRGPIMPSGGGGPILEGSRPAPEAD